MNEIITFAKANLESVRRCFTSMKLVGVVLVVGWLVLLMRQSAPAILSSLFGLVSQAGVFVAATVYLCAERRQRVLERLPAAITLVMCMVLVHLILVVSVVWPSIDMLPLIASFNSNWIFLMIGVMPAAILVSGGGYASKHILIGAALGLPMLLWLAGVVTLVQNSAWATPLIRAVLDIAVGVAAGASYSTAEAQLQSLEI